MLKTFRRARPDAALEALVPTMRSLQHRSMRRLEFPPQRWVSLLLLPPLFNALLWTLRDDIGNAWEMFFRFWLKWLALPGSVSWDEMPMPANWVLILPVLHVPASLPEPTICLVTLFATLALLALSFAISESYMPLRYLLRLVVLIQATALFYFYFFPTSFPYSAKNHVSDGLLLTSILLMAIPWLHALTYYIFPFSLLQKLTLTSLTLLYFIVFGPAQYLLHAWLLQQFSLIVLPLLYLLFGAFLDILMLISLYGWAMSWPCRKSE